MIDGTQITRWRLIRGLTLRQLAALSGVDASAISAIERGQRQPRPSTLLKLSAALAVHPGELLRRE
jgi:transcriptional regulator with XRE-family HTH domain